MARDPKETAKAVQDAGAQEEVDAIINQEAPGAEEVNAVSDALEADGR